MGGWGGRPYNRACPPISCHSRTFSQDSKCECEHTCSDEGVVSWSIVTTHQTQPKHLTIESIKKRVLPLDKLQCVSSRRKDYRETLTCRLFGADDSQVFLLHFSLFHYFFVVRAEIKDINTFLFLKKEGKRKPR